MEDQKTLDLVRELVLRLLSGGDPHRPPPDHPRAVRLAVRLLSSRLSAPLPADPRAAAEPIKRRLVRLGRPSDALSLSSLLSSLSSKSGPGSIRDLPSLLHLLHSLSLDRRRPPPPPPLPLDSSPPTRPLRRSLYLAKDGDSLREIALREYADLVRAESPIPEQTLVRDLLFISQGIDGKHLRYNPASDGYDLPDSLPPSSKTTLLRLCELGWLFRKVHRFVSAADLVGAAAQAFSAAISDELSDFYRLLAVLANDENLSLRRLAVWLAEPLHRLRWLAILVDSCEGKRGGALAGAAHALSQHGDPAVRTLTGRVLGRLRAPFSAMVRAWVLHGELRDPHSEFFVRDRAAEPAVMWRHGYVIDPSMVPCFISPELAGKILRTGKSINFLRACCQDNAWTSGAEDEEGDELETMVEAAAGRTDRHLLEVVNGRFRFRDHCWAVKRYLLLGQGDFVQRLLDLVNGELSRPAKGISVFHLAGLLESAIRGSNAQYDDVDILGRIKVRMMEAGEGETDGWDVFSLEYEARAPLDTVFSAEAMGGYLKVFNFLVKLRRVERALVAAWRGGGLGRRWEVLRSEMSHFVGNLQCYIMFEVLEVSWARFVEEMEVARDLDRLINAHERYLSAVLEKSLLGERSREINRTLLDLLDIILKFRFAADRRLQGIPPSQPRGTRKPKQKNLVKLTKMAEESREPDEELEKIARDYSASLNRFLILLPAQQHVDLKFLLFRLDFTEFYSRLSSKTVL